MFSALTGSPLQGLRCSCLHCTPLPAWSGGFSQLSHTRRRSSHASLSYLRVARPPRTEEEPPVTDLDTTAPAEQFFSPESREALAEASRKLAERLQAHTEALLAMN